MFCTLHRRKSRNHQFKKRSHKMNFQKSRWLSTMTQNLLRHMMVGLCIKSRSLINNQSAGTSIWYRKTTQKTRFGSARTYLICSTLSKPRDFTETINLNPTNVLFRTTLTMKSGCSSTIHSLYCRMSSPQSKWNLTIDCRGNCRSMLATHLFQFSKEASTTCLLKA